MEKCGDVDDCISTTEADELAAKFDEEKIKNLPVPGEVQFINGGPPCQVFAFIFSLLLETHLSNTKDGFGELESSLVLAGAHAGLPNFWCICWVLIKSFLVFLNKR